MVSPARTLASLNLPGQAFYREMDVEPPKRHGSHHAFVISLAFVEAQCDRSIVLQPGKGVFYQVPDAVASVPSVADWGIQMLVLMARERSPLKGTCLKRSLA